MGNPLSIFFPNNVIDNLVHYRFEILLSSNAGRSASIISSSSSEYLHLPLCDVSLCLAKCCSSSMVMLLCIHSSIAFLLLNEWRTLFINLSSNVSLYVHIALCLFFLSVVCFPDAKLRYLLRLCKKFSGFLLIPSYFLLLTYSFFLLTCQLAGVCWRSVPST